MANIKSLFTGLMLSLSKVEKEELASMFGNGGVNLHQEDKVTQKEIKIISSKRFYELMERADAADKRRHSAKMELLMEKRGIKGEMVRTFKNVKSSDMFATHSEVEINGEFTFKTSNKIYKYADSAFIVKNGDYLDLHINISLLNENQRLKGVDFSDLKYFGVVENHKYFLYGIVSYIETKISGGEMTIVFEVNTVMDGEVSNRLNDNESIMRKEDLIDPRTHNYFQNGNDYNISL